ncbi:hypothetical protein MKL09_14425 [Methylobacterium sp. J-048]|uniref:hypothetical protein n=1 Tax=Methylobacterium sp. J-048 TaxID=2836635 RepID=UPI001FBBB580|nr:hypothetical protein [Methylobacterium sp. J-048]MCJ2057747.1 hypothetical protein [Methylobacterium sp. J-048]
MNLHNNLPDHADDLLTDLLAEALDGSDPIRVRYLIEMIGQNLDSRYELPGVPDVLPKS